MNIKIKEEITIEIKLDREELERIKNEALLSFNEKYNINPKNMDSKISELINKIYKS